MARVIADDSIAGGLHPGRHHRVLPGRGRIDPNDTSCGGLWCSFSLLEAFYLVPMRKDLPMKTRQWLLHARTRAGGSARGAHSKPATGTARVWAMRGILLMVLVLGGLSAAAALSGHHAAGHAGGRLVSFAHIPQIPWMF
jgi:hypothetical protein